MSWVSVKLNSRHHDTKNAVAKSNITGQANQQQMNAGRRQLALPEPTPHPTD